MSNLVSSFSPIDHQTSTLVEPKIDLIPLAVKKTLDNLFGGPGSVDRLPVFMGDLNDLKIEMITDPIMRATVTDPSSNKTVPCILIKMRCLSSLETVKNQCIFAPENLKEPIERVYGIAQLPDNPMMWHQMGSDTLTPKFFLRTYYEAGNFTDGNGQLIKEHVRSFNYLQNFIKNWGGEDMIRLHWEIVAHKT